MKTKKAKEKILNLIDKDYERDEEGRIVIKMKVSDDSNFLSVFSDSETPVINGDVAEFLENATCSVNANEKLTLKIFGDCIDENEKVVYKDAIKEYYKKRFAENESKKRRYNFMALWLAIFGIFVLAASIFIGYRLESAIWAEVVDIVAWVLLWEATDIKFFTMREISNMQKRYSAFIDMKIEYTDKF